MADRDFVDKKLAELRIYVEKLEELRSLSLEEIRSSMHKAWAVEHGLLLSIQLIIDIGNHLLASVGDICIENYIDVFDELGSQGIIPKDFTAKIRGMAGFRNLLIHEYTKVDLERVYEVLQTRLEDFKEFSCHIRDYLDKTQA